MENNSKRIMELICLGPEEQKDPELALVRLFDATDFEYLRVHLWHFLKAVVAEDYFRLLEQPVIVCEVVKNFELIIDVFYLLAEKKKEPEAGSAVLNACCNEDRSQADRQYMMTLYKILSDYDGHIRRLRKEEIANLYLVAEGFFSFYSRSQWSEELKNWQYYALANDSICVASDETNMLEMYEHLEKLLEAAYLLHQRGTMEYDSAPGKVRDFFLQKKRSRGFPQMLSAEEQNDPFTYICLYFGGTTLSEHARELSEWIQAVFGKCVWDEHDPGELVFFYEEMVKLVESAFELYSQKECGVEWIEGAAGFCRPMKEPSGYHIHPHYLDKKEAEDPWLVLEELCDHKLNNYHERLRDWLYQALVTSSLTNSNEDLYFYNLLQKLAEALYTLSVEISKAGDDQNC